jgi:hypothetical protein
MSSTPILHATHISTNTQQETDKLDLEPEDYTEKTYVKQHMECLDLLYEIRNQ